MQRTEECWWESELFRLRGELLMQCKVPSENEAEACFRQAIDIAARQQAKSLELRSMTSLAGLLRASGRAREARTSLSEIYSWFTEGFDTADLMDAKALLDELQEPNAAAARAPTRA